MRRGRGEVRWMMGTKPGEGGAREMVRRVVVVLTLGSHGVGNQVDCRYLTFYHCHGPPSFKEDREVGEDRLRLS